MLKKVKSRPPSIAGRVLLNFTISKDTKYLTDISRCCFLIDKMVGKEQNNMNMNTQDRSFLKCLFMNHLNILNYRIKKYNFCRRYFYW